MHPDSHRIFSGREIEAVITCTVESDGFKDGGLVTMQGSYNSLGTVVKLLCRWRILLIRRRLDRIIVLGWGLITCRWKSRVENVGFDLQDSVHVGCDLGLVVFRIEELFESTRSYETPWADDIGDDLHKKFRLAHLCGCDQEYDGPETATLIMTLGKVKSW